MADAWGYREAAENFTQPLNWALMQNWKFGDEKKRLAEQEVMRESILKLQQRGDVSTKAAESSAWSAYDTQTATSPEGQLYDQSVLSAQGSEALQMGGPARVASLQGISDQAKIDKEIKRLSDITNQTTVATTLNVSVEKNTIDMLDKLNTKRNNYVKATGQQYPSDNLDRGLQDINSSRKLAKLPLFTVRDLNDLKTFHADIEEKHIGEIQGKVKNFLMPKTTNEDRASLAGELSVMVTAFRKQYGDPQAFFEVPDMIKQYSDNLVKSVFPTPEKPLRALKTIYGPGGRTQEVQVEEGYKPPSGWSLKAPEKPEKPEIKPLAAASKVAQIDAAIARLKKGSPIDALMATIDPKLGGLIGQEDEVSMDTAIATLNVTRGEYLPFTSKEFQKSIGLKGGQTLQQKVPSGFTDSGKTSGGKKVYVNPKTKKAWIEP